MEVATGLKHAHTTFRQAQATITHMGLDLNANEFSNPMRSGGRMSPEDQLRCALRGLEIKGFLVRCLQKYVVEGGDRQRVVVGFFNAWQIRMARRFMGEFNLQTDATFNTSHLNLPIAVIVGTSNVVRSFPATYCFVISESKEAFTFIFDALKMIFHDCIGPRVVISDFVLGLSSAMCRTRHISRAEADVEDRMTMLQIHVFGTDLQLQLCAWHAVEAIRKRLTHAGRYPAKLQTELQNLLWS